MPFVSHAFNFSLAAKDIDPNVSTVKLMASFLDMSLLGYDGARADIEGFDYALEYIQGMGQGALDLLGSLAFWYGGGLPPPANF